jgi:hypothetical protein
MENIPGHASKAAGIPGWCRQAGAVYPRNGEHAAGCRNTRRWQVPGIGGRDYHVRPGGSGILWKLLRFYVGYQFDGGVNPDVNS